ncbi:MAG: nucleotidyltransferase family protein [Anaerolineae bacterium]|jgi:predicted nucleotidyltransferase
MNPSRQNPPTLAELRAKRHEILALAERYGAYDVRVFGSVARGNAEVDSDVDILVQFHAHSLLDRIGLQRQLSDLLACHVDVVTEKMMKPHVRTMALRDAVRL